MTACSKKVQRRPYLRTTKSTLDENVEFGYNDSSYSAPFERFCCDSKSRYVTGDRCISNTKAHKTAKKRRDSTMSAVAELADLLPLPDGTDPGKLKTNHILRLVVKYIHIKHLIQNSVIPTQNKLCSGRVGSSGSSKSGSAQDVPKKKPHAFELLGLSSNDVLSFGNMTDKKLHGHVYSLRSLMWKVPSDNRGVCQSLFALDGFILVVNLQTDDLEIVYVSESIYFHLGLYMVDLVGLSLLNLVTEQDRDTVKETLTGGEEYLFGYRSFFCQVRSAKGKRPNGRTKSPGRKLVYVSGRIRQHILNSGNSESEMLYFVGIAQVVKTSASAKVYPGLTSSFLTCRTTLELKVIEVNSERVTENVNCKDYWHPDDLSWNLVSFEKLLNDGQVVWFCHRIMYEGQWRWVQAQSSLVKNKFFEHSVAFVSDEVGKRVLAVRVAQAKNGILGSVSSPSQQSTGLFTSSSDSYLKEKSPATTTAAAATEVSDSFITCIASVSPQNSPSPQHSPGFTKLEKQLKPLPENRVITSELYRGIIPTLTNVVYPDQTSDCSMKGGSWDIEKAGSECLFWDSPSPPRFASLPTDEAESLCGSKEVDNIHCPADTLGRQMPVADCMFSPPDLTEMALFSALENVECDIPDVDLSCLDEILCQVQDNYLPMEPAGEERSKGFDQSVTVTKPLHTTVSTSFSPPLFSPSCTSAADPVCTIEICDKNTQSAYCQGSLLGNGCSELPVQPPPLTWDWAVGVNFMSDMKK